MPRHQLQKGKGQPKYWDARKKRDRVRKARQKMQKEGRRANRGR